MLPFQASRDEEDEKHVHPLQLDVIDRAVVLWSNAGETVLTPFMGVGSEVYGAVANGRRGVGIELKPSYFKQALKNVATAGDGPQTEQVALFGMGPASQKPGGMRPEPEGDSSPQRDRYARVRLNEDESMDGDDPA